MIEGIVEGCKRAGCALLGGETAELPGMYLPGEYDLAGFVVGVASAPKMLAAQDVRVGDIVIGLASDGLHSNGYSLARKALLDPARSRARQRGARARRAAGRRAAAADAHVLQGRARRRARGGVKAYSHITGGGLPGNLPRVLPDGLGIQLDREELAAPCDLRPDRRARARRHRRNARHVQPRPRPGRSRRAPRARELLAVFERAGERASIVGKVVEVGANAERVQFLEPRGAAARP